MAKYLQRNNETECTFSVTGACKSTILATINMLIIHFFTFQQDQEELLARPAASEVELSQDLE